MGTKYTSQSISGYNTSPPPDDGTQVAANQVTWAKHKTKLADPVKTLSEAINTALAAHVDEGPDAKTSNYTAVAGDYKKVLECSGTFTVTLPDASTIGAGYEVTVKNSGSGTITVAPTTTADGIDGDANLTLSVNAVVTVFVNAAANAYLSRGGTNSAGIVQQVRTATSVYNNGSTQIPTDNTIPQNTEGNEFMTLAITPTDSNHILDIEVIALVGGSINTAVIVALFQDSTADAIAATMSDNGQANALMTIPLRYTMTAGTTAATTFKVRAGLNGAGTCYFNGVAANLLGGVEVSSITITERRA